MEAHPHKAINGPATVALSICWLLTFTVSAKHHSRYRPASSVLVASSCPEFGHEKTRFTCAIR